MSVQDTPLLIVEDDLALQKQIKWTLDRYESVTASDRESAQYVRELGGSIDVASDPGSGTVMSVVLPLFESGASHDLQAQAVS